MRERRVVKTDNRDDRTTWLHLDQDELQDEQVREIEPEYVEINPAELFRNLLANNLENDQIERLEDILQGLVDDYRDGGHSESQKPLEFLYDVLFGVWPPKP